MGSDVGALVNFLVLMTLLFGGLAQTATLPPRVGRTLAVACAVAAMSLAFVRYSRSGKR